MKRTLVPSLLGVLALAVGSVPAARAQDPEPAPGAGVAPTARADKLAYQEALTDWWGAAGHLHMGDSAYRIDAGNPLVFEDGLCTATLNEGMLVPVWSGRPPLSDRIVGFVFVGDGDLSVDVPLRADRWRLANHAARYDLLTEAEQRAIAREGAPLRTEIERGLVLSADPRIAKLLEDLEPVGGGVMIKVDDFGTVAGETYVVTDSAGRSRVQAIATNLLPNRRLQLQRAGMDPRIWLRQDRLLHDEIGIDGSSLRALSDWRTDKRFRVAAERGAGVSNSEYDRWLSCFRDPMDQEGLGFSQVAMAVGTDLEGRRHLERFAGTPLAPVEERPGAWLSPVSADTTVFSRPKGMGNQRWAEVETTMTLEAHGGTVRHATLSMPVDGALRNGWELVSLTMADGRPLASVSLTEQLSGADQVAGMALVESTETGDGSDATADNSGEEAAQAESDAGADAAGTSAGSADGGGISAGAEGPGESQLGTDLQDASQIGSGIGSGMLDESSFDDRAAVQDSPASLVVQVVLPEPVAEGEQVSLTLKWKARWLFAQRSVSGANLGTTTGLQPLLPELVPRTGDDRWDTVTRVANPALGLSNIDTSIAGKTVREWEDEDGWTWIEAEAEDARAPAIAIGRWQTQVDLPQLGMPAVRVHLFTRDAWALPMFAPEVRRLITFFQRFLPRFPLDEIDVYQGPSGFRGSIIRGDRPPAGHGMVAVNTVKTTDVTDVGEIGAMAKHLAQATMARQVAAQYWGQLVSPDSNRDAWLLDGLAEAYAGFYLRGAFGNDDYADRMEALRKRVEDPREYQANYGRTNRSKRYLSLTGATPASDVPDGILRDYGAYMLSDVLRLHVGDQAFFGAMDRLAREHQGRSITTDEVQTALEEASGMDLSEMFDWWIHGGLIPEITVEIREEAAADGTVTVHGCIESDLPWGSFDVPIEVRDEGGDPMSEEGTARSVSALVDVDDGRGGFEVGGRKGEIEIVADPMGMIVAYDRKVKRVTETACDRAMAAAPRSSTPLPAPADPGPDAAPRTGSDTDGG
ncbi:MAG: hypothetical protein H6742_03980 [Alphaproteobacteria bacterium]|nr:hypothetical protein [Alphaproteobacteria bacterium]